MVKEKTELLFIVQCIPAINSAIAMKVRQKTRSKFNFRFEMVMTGKNSGSNVDTEVKMFRNIP